MYSINVIVITYNQEKYIGRALDSILCQRDYGLKNIIVVDDCSTDANWKVISDYVDRYPTIIKAYRNEKNLGIYENAEKSVGLRGDADLYCRCSGDDALRDGWFKAVQERLKGEKVDSNVSFMVQGDYMTIQPDGKEKIFSQKAVNNCHTPLEMLLVRSKIHGRSTVLSKALFNRFEPTILDKGLNLAETYADIQKFIHADKLFYTPYVGSIYYMRIGVAKDLSQQKEKYDDYWIDGNIVKWEYFRDNVLKRCVDRNYANYSINRCKFEKTGKLSFCVKAVLWRFVGIDFWIDNPKMILKDIHQLVKSHGRYMKRFAQ